MDLIAVGILPSFHGGLQTLMPENKLLILIEPCGKLAPAPNQSLVGDLNLLLVGFIALDDQKTGFRPLQFIDYETHSVFIVALREESFQRHTSLCIFFTKT